VVGGAKSPIGSLKQFVVLLLSILPGVYLGKLIAWHPLDTALGWAAVGVGTVILVLYPSRKGHKDAFDAYSDGRGTGPWWWGWAYGTVCIIGVGLGLAMEGGHTP